MDNGLIYTKHRRAFYLNIKKKNQEMGYSVQSSWVHIRTCNVALTTSIFAPLTLCISLSVQLTPFLYY